jgi:hypothetical protein
MRYFPIQGSVCLVVACNLKSAILLELFDDRIRDQNLYTRYEGTIFERRHRNGMDVSEIVRLYGPDVIPKTPSDREAKKCRKWDFQGAGDADPPGTADAPGALEGSELVLVPGKGTRGSGAVVVSGASEAGGGSELSDADEGKGASLLTAPGFADPVSAVRDPCPLAFFVAFCDTCIAG